MTATESSSSSSTSSGNDSSEPQPKLEINEVLQQITGSEPEPEPGAEGLTLTWNSPPISGVSEQVDLDVVTVHGMYGSWDDGRASLGSGNSSWVDRYLPLLASDSRILRFKYNASQILAGRHSRSAIRKRALRLLDDLIKLRKNEPKKRLIMFVTHDIGGMIVKDALAASALNPASWGEIFDYSRLLIFYGCPHRSIDSLDMENTLSRFLFAAYDPNVTKMRPTVASIPGLAAAVIEINGLFVESKVHLRSYVISIHANGFSSEEIHDVFDNYTSVLGVPFEKRIAEISWAEEHPEYLDKLFACYNWDAYFVPDAKLLRHERTLLSLASPVYPFKAAQQPLDNWITKTETYQAWLDHPGLQLLYVQGTDDVREAAEQIFYSLDNLVQTRNTHEVVLYFSFDRWDVRCDSIKDMLATFLVQIICHRPARLSVNVEILFEYLNQGRGWTESDLIHWFNLFRSTDLIDGVICVINYFDECVEASRKAFLKLFQSCVVRDNETPWRIAVTSRKPGVLLDELSRWPYLNLDAAASEAAPESTQVVVRDMWRLVQLRPELSELDELFRKELDGLADLDPLTRHIICEQARLCREWPEETSIQNLLGPLDNLSDNRSLEWILDRVLRNISDRGTVRRLLSWLLYCVRPLTTWELATVMFIGTDQDRGGEAFPSPPLLEDLISKMETWFAGIIEVKQNEVRIRHPRLRDIFMAHETEGGSQYLWNEIKETADFDITKLCLDYLSRASVQRIIEETYQAPDSNSVEAPTFPDRGNLCSYAVQAWTHHLSRSSLSSSYLDPSKLLDNFMQSASFSCWSKGYWALSNPITRSNRYFETLYPIFVGLGFPKVVKHRDDKDLSRGLLEAAANGQASTVKDLLERTEHSKSTLLDALVAAGSGGEEQIVLDLIDHISVKMKIDTADWPTTLLYRAAWLGLDRLAERLLELGCPADPDGPLQAKTRLTPLFLATYNGHLSTIRVLMKYNANVGFRNRYGRTPLHATSIVGHAKVAKVLVEEGRADLEGKDEAEVTALYLASVWGSHETVEELLRLDADPNMGVTDEPTSQGWSPLAVAADNGFQECVRALLEGNANPNVSGPDGIDTPLRYAAVSGHLEVCRLLLEKGAKPNHSLIKPPILVQVVNLQGALSTQKKRELVELLLDNDASVDATDDEGMSALIYAVRNDCEPLVRCLLDNNADINLAGEGGRRPLYFAVQEQKADMVELLLQRGADVDCRTSQGLAPLHVAHPSAEITRLLLEKNANPDLRDSQGLTELMYVASRDHVACAELLLKHNAAVDAEVDRDSEYWAGWTAVSFAARYGQPDMVRLLAEAGADLKHKAREGVCPLQFAMRGNTLHALLEFRTKVDLDQVDDKGNAALHTIDSNDVPITNVKLLVRGGAKLDIQNKIGDTPLTMAVWYNNLDVVSFLLKQDLDINLGSDCYGAALHQACRKSFTDMVKMLVEHGADVNFTVPGPPGSPLQSACLPFTSNENNYSEELVRYLLENGAVADAQGGMFGSPISAAALSGAPSIVSLLLGKEVNIGLGDGMDRMPIHFAALHGIDNFRLILDAGGSVKACDKTGRTALHWAAQAGRARVVELILSLLPRIPVDERDIDGWTPLCWSARGTGKWYVPNLAGEAEDQIKVIQLLLKHGADRFVQSSIGEQKWSPLTIAHYCGAGAEVIDLLKRGLGEESSDGFENAAAAAGDDPNDKPKRAYQTNSTCDACLWYIRGLLYKCEVCIDFDFCSKCYARRDILHADHPNHTFKEVGPEFEPEDDGTGSSDTSSTSDSDSDS